MRWRSEIGVAAAVAMCGCGWVAGLGEYEFDGGASGRGGTAGFGGSSGTGGGGAGGLGGGGGAAGSGGNAGSAGADASAGSGGDAGVAGAAGAGGVSSPDCQACAFGGQCASQATACAGESGCAACLVAGSGAGCDPTNDQFEALLACLHANCHDECIGGAAGSSGAAGSGGCIEIDDVADLTLANGDGAAYAFYEAVPLPPIGDIAVPDGLGLQFYVDTTGAFDLAAGGNENYATCAQCVLVSEDVDSMSGPNRVYFPTSGALTVDPSTPPITSAPLRATLEDVTLVEVTLDPNTWESTPVSNGQCLHVTHAQLGCGNDMIDSSEACDGAELGGVDCAALGFTDGTVSCSAECQIDHSLCTGWTCDAFDLGVFVGTTLVSVGDSCLGRPVFDAGKAGTSCTTRASAGREDLWTVTLHPGGRAEVVLIPTGYEAALWVSSSCDDFDGTSCIGGSDASGIERVTIENSEAADAIFYLVADGRSLTDCGQYEIRVRSVPQTPGTWSCDPGYYAYASFDSCDCQCGAWDPDCEEPTLLVYGCSGPQICVPPGICQ